MARPNLVVNWNKYLSVDNTEFINYVSTYRNSFIDTLVDNVISAHKKKTPSLVLFRFSKTTIKTIAYLSDYEIILHRLMDICKKVELYENCAKIQSHFNTLQRKVKPSYSKLNHIKQNG